MRFNLQSVKLKMTLNPPAVPFTRPNPEYEQYVFDAFSTYVPPVISEQVFNGYRLSDATADGVITNYMLGNQPYCKHIDDEHFQHAASVVKTILSPFKSNPDKLKPVHFVDTAKYPWNMTSNAGYPFNTQGQYLEILRKRKEADSALNQDEPYPEIFSEDINHKVDTSGMRDLWFEHGRAWRFVNTTHPNKGNMFNIAFHYCRSFAHKIKDTFIPPNLNPNSGFNMPYVFPNLAYAKPSIVAASAVDKVRMIFGVCWLLLMIECMFYWPHAHRLMKYGSALLWKYETINGGLQNIAFEIYAAPYAGTFLSFDWSQFDRRVLFSLIDYVFSVWRTYYDFSKYMPTKFYPDADADPKRIESLWNWMIYMIKHAPDVLPNGDAYVRLFNSLPSGAFHTQLLDSWINALMTLTILSALGFRVTPEMIAKFLGDDSFVMLYVSIPESMIPEFNEAFKQEAVKRFNAKISEKNQINDRFARDHKPGIKILGYQLYHSMPWRDEVELLTHLVYTWRGYTLPQLKSRCVGLAYANFNMSKVVYRVAKHIHDKLDAADVPYSKMPWREAFAPSDPYMTEAIPDHFPSRLECIGNCLVPRSQFPSALLVLWQDHFISE